MNYAETVAYLYAQLPMFTRIGAAAYKNNLNNTIELCTILDHPQQKFKSIHIAGTNGKGSTSHMLASILQEAGYTVGLYTSPHLKDFRERIRINGEMIPEQYVVDFVKNYKHEFDRIEPSFFEWTVGLCFDYFAHQQVDIAIIETGLGGRLDSTNIITPLLSIITNIGWDHTDLLGDTLPKIAVEKAGIIKPEIPIIISEYQTETVEVFEQRANALHSPIIFSKECIQLTSYQNNNLTCSFNVYYQSEEWLKNVSCDLPGNYQQQNIPTVLTAIQQLKKLNFTVTDKCLKKGLSQVKKNTGLMGRWQLLANNPLTICDTGHNSNGIEYIVKQLKQLNYSKLHMVIGMVKDKDITKILSLLPKNATYYFCNAPIPRSLVSTELKQQASVFGLQGNAFNSVKEALENAQMQANNEDLIFIGGSTFVVAEVV